ncbi:MAG: LysR family transcriptional regulator [Oscillibacter sp.]|nr:LysR family transcriptional regulator [Oscillibacter sp.]
MEIQQLEEFVSLVETCSFQRTAEEVNVSQSALTKHIQKLEEELGVTFFDRSTRSVKTNAYSRAFYPYAKQALQFFQEGRRELSSLTNQNKWVLRVAYSPGSARYGVIELLSAFSRENPQFSLQTQESHQVTELLYGRQCDFAFATEEALPDRQMNQIVYETDRLAVILPLDHPLAGENSITLEQIRDERFILHTKQDGTPHLENRKFLELCEEKGIAPNICASSSFTSNISRMVNQKQGIAVMNRYQFPGAGTAVAVVDFQPKIETCIYMIYLNRTRLSAPARSFLNYLLQRDSGGED